MHLAYACCVLTTPLRPKALVLVTHSRGIRKVRVIISHRSGSCDPCGSGGAPGQGSKRKKVIRGKFVLDRKTVPGTKTAGGRACRKSMHASLPVHGERLHDSDDPRVLAQPLGGGYQVGSGGCSLHRMLLRIGRY